jgi:glycine cleavage system T protein
MKRSPLDRLHRARGAQMMEYEGWEVPAVYSSVEQEYQALQEGVGLIDRSYRGKLRIVGEDRRAWLQGLVTQDVVALADGTGAEAALLNAQGHLLSEMRIFALPGALLCDVSTARAAFVREHLDRYLVMERAEIQDLTGEFALLSLQGQLAALAIRAAFGEKCAELPRWGARAARCDDIDLILVRASQCGEDGFDMFVPARQAARLFAALCLHAPEFAVTTVGFLALNQRRIEAGVPWWGSELDETVTPVAARMESAISRQKGCYIGQEIIARLDARGQVNNLLTGLVLAGHDVPLKGAEVFAGERKVGRVTSAVRSPTLDRVIALSYVRREFTGCGQQLLVRRDDGQQEAVVTELPFVPNDY